MILGREQACKLSAPGKALVPGVPNFRIGPQRPMGGRGAGGNAAGWGWGGILKLLCLPEGRRWVDA